MKKPMLNARISSGYGERQNPFDKTKTQFHGGIDLVPLTEDEENQKIYFPYAGRIDFIGKSDSFGNRIWLKIKDASTKFNGKFIVLAHMDSFNPELILSKNVKAGDFAGIVGSTGKSTAKHLHLEVADWVTEKRKSFNPDEISNAYEVEKTENIESNKMQVVESVKDKKESIKSKSKKENGNNNS